MDARTFVLWTLVVYSISVVYCIAYKKLAHLDLPLIESFEWALINILP